MPGSSSAGLFITFEGIDGAGKSTHLQATADHFAAQGRSVVVTREPGGTPLAEALRETILREPMDPLAEVLLIFAARRDHVVRVIAPALAQGKVVVCDRFTDSTFAYQGFGRDFPLDVLAQLEHWTHPALQPDLTFWFDLAPEVAAARRAAARAPDRFEREQQAFFERVRSGYAQRAADFAARFVRIDAAGGMGDIGSQITAVLARLPTTR